MRQLQIAPELPPVRLRLPSIQTRSRAVVRFVCLCHSAFVLAFVLRVRCVLFVEVVGSIGVEGHSQRQNQNGVAFSSHRRCLHYAATRAIENDSTATVAGAETDSCRKDTQSTPIHRPRDPDAAATHRWRTSHSRMYTTDVTDAQHSLHRPPFFFYTPSNTYSLVFSRPLPSLLPPYTARSARASNAIIAVSISDLDLA